jgi:hypothetical protein
LRHARSTETHADGLSFFQTLFGIAIAFFERQKQSETWNSHFGLITMSKKAFKVALSFRIFVAEASKKKKREKYKADWYVQRPRYVKTTKKCSAMTS